MSLISGRAFFLPRIAVTLSTFCVFENVALAQCSGKTGIARAICEASARKKLPIPGVNPDSLMGPIINDLVDPNRQPITSSFASARRGGTLPSNFTPESSIPMRFLPRTSDGAYVLRPGFYEGDVQSYCLKAGTHGPSKGNGYLPAPLEGPKADIVRSILKQSVLHPEVRQQDIQVLLWAIIARSDYDHMPPTMQRTAATLLSRQQIAQLNGPLGRLPQALRQPLERKLQEQLNAVRSPLQRVFQAESQMRQHVASSASYSVLEQTAVLTGLAPDQGAAIAPEWVQHPQGYYVRYLPSSYSKTKIQLYMPEQAVASSPQSVTFDPSAELAMPANTGSQRLAMTGRERDGEGEFCPIPIDSPDLSSRITVYEDSLKAHRAIKIDTAGGSVTFGFGPRMGNAGGAIPFPTPGKIDEGTGYADITNLSEIANYPISSIVAERIVKGLRKLVSDPPFYHPAGFNCRQFTCFVVSSATPESSSMARCFLPY